MSPTLKTTRWLPLALMTLPVVACVAVVPPPPPPPPGPEPVAEAGVAVTAPAPPPPLPTYEQPPAPAPGYLWTPGVWHYGPDGYFWVPGTWVQPPSIGLLWTPPYWGWRGGVYAFNAGYWGPHVGFYGGINYGFGFGGIGFEGGYWDHGSFQYNTAVTNVNTTVIHNTYNKTVINNNTAHTSFNGPKGIEAKPTPEEVKAAHERHVPPTQEQQKHIEAAKNDRSQLAKVNGGRPAVTATAKPGELHPAAEHEHEHATPEHKEPVKPAAHLKPTEHAKPEPKTDAPKQAPKKEAPKAEAPRREAPKKETPEKKEPKKEEHQ
jgi:hypothetical protein